MGETIPIKEFLEIVRNLEYSIQDCSWSDEIVGNGKIHIDEDCGVMQFIVDLDINGTNFSYFLRH